MSNIRDSIQVPDPDTEDSFGTARVRVEESLHLENNSVARVAGLGSTTSTLFEVLDITFPASVHRVKITGSNLGRIKSNFMSGIEVQNIEISRSRMKLDGESTFKIAAGNFQFTNNQVEAVVTEAVAVSVKDEATIAHNNFEHLQQQSLRNIKPVGEMSKLALVNNSFHNFERGFLQLDPDWGNIGQLEVGTINLQEPCDCNLIHQLTAATKPHSETAPAENKLIKSSFCIGDNISGTSFYTLLYFQRKFKTNGFSYKRTSKVFESLKRDNRNYLQLY